MYRKFTSDQIFTGKDWAPPNTAIVADEAGKILQLAPLSGSGDDVTYLDGILCPGFINAHVHLELSHMKARIAQHTGLVNFLLQVVHNRNADADNIRKAMQEADDEMWNNGIVAAADICNTTDTIPVKQHSRIRWKNFIELINTDDLKAAESFRRFHSIKEIFDEQLQNDENNSDNIITPHAPYTVSPSAFQMINANSSTKTVTIHMQECAAENQLFVSGDGDFLSLYSHFGINNSPLPVTGKSSIQSILPYFTNQQRIILVHNTFTNEDDIDFVSNFAAKNDIEIVYCICPNANMYIENKLPPMDLLVNKNLKIVLGTDSYSSNQQLSIAAEISTLHKYFPQIGLSTILNWATLGGAEALQIDESFGSFDTGKTPGIVLIDKLWQSKRIL